MHGIVIDTRGRPLNGLHRLWPALVLRGTVLTAFGLLMLVWPQLTGTVLVTLIGALLLVDGLSTLAYGFTRRRLPGRRSNGWAFQGLLTLGLGLLGIFVPEAIAEAILTILGVLSIVVGVALLGFSAPLRRVRSKAWLAPFLLGLAAVVLGIVVISEPTSSATGLITGVGVLVLLIGVTLVGGGLRLRRGQLT
jgi:uncharacterized membrane protein HdeD (DUF308 family)